MSSAFDLWLAGRPVVPLGEVGGTFSTWESGRPVLTADVPEYIVTSDSVLFRGEIVRASIRGKVITARCQTGGAIFDRQIPRFRMQTGCNHTLFDTGCGLAKADWKFTATVADPGTPGFPFTFDLSGLARVSGAAPTFTDQWFAGGWIEFGSGTSWCRRPILRSTTVTAGALTVTLGADPLEFPEAGDAVVLYPGCDGRWETCGAYHATNNPAGRFNNRVNFGGHPFMPIANPSLVKVSESVGGGKKS